MTVAVIIPNRNYGCWIDDALYSVECQTVPPDEVIIVDGGSTDHSKTVASFYSHRWLASEPKGIANARNVGVAAARSDLIVPLDADDWIAATYIERCLEKMADGVGVVATQLLWPNGVVQKPSPPFTTATYLTGNRLFTCSMFRRKCWEEVGGYDESPGIYEDWLFFGRVTARGWQTVVVDAPLFHHRPHAGSSSARMSGLEADYRRRTVEKLRQDEP